MVSVVIPTLNEAPNLAHCIAAVHASSAAFELVIVDANSADETRALALRLGAKVIISPVRQRACQLNIGARNCRGDALLFLHADTLLPPNSLQKIEWALSNFQVGGGAFARRFDSDSSFLRFSCALASLRNSLIGWHLGDQAMFVRRQLFEKLGGFKEIDRFEDLDFSRRLGAETRLVTLRPPVISSARRFEKDGAIKRTIKDFWLTLSYLTGPSRPTELPPHGKFRMGRSRT